MKIRHGRITPFCLPLRRPLVTAHETLRVRDGFLLLLEVDDGRVGWGEASPLAGFGMESTEECRTTLERLTRHLLGRDVRELDALLDECGALAPAAPGARSAVDSALHDINARLAGASVASWLAARQSPGRVRQRIQVNALVSGMDECEVVEAARRDLANGFETFKLKVGGASLAHDLKRVLALRGTIESHHRMRVDANGAWSEEVATRALERLAQIGVEYVEQPVAATNLSAMARLRERALVPIAADESLRGEADAARLIERRAADLLVVKPAVAGGLRAAWRIAAAARDAGLEVVVTSSLDSAVAVASALQLAAALPGPLPACGLATSALLERDLASALPVQDGSLLLPNGPGLGVVPDAALLEKCASGPASELHA